MARRRNLPSLSVPIVMASIAVLIAIALLAGWTIIFAQNLAKGDDVAANVWLLVLGVIAFATLMSVMIMFAVFLGREILEVRRQDSFIDSVTHELKSPLASLKLGLQTLGRPGVSEEKRELLREMMLDDVDRLSAFVDDILQASRLAHGGDRVGMDLSAVGLRAVAEECAEGVLSRHRLPPESLVIDVDPALKVQTDRAALTVVLRNLMDNAVKYSEEPVRVVIRAEAADDEGVTIEVQDSGIGIPEKDLKRVFNRFYRVPLEGVRKRKGTGLGLFVVSALVRNLGGHVEATSEGPGRGATMRVTLPPAHADEAA
ncbi:MAG TPA: HAMP domain-containing sensor histidine kinase [Sandaracinaceae bacterium LLY-WYZ-13_1]|nr:HAMP domain-containing sensor histidine kinase [Sandaracinaceae bacterium LLY-WYZ-13_1]